MESNKEEAQKCIAIAQRAFTQGDVRKALKFLHKSLQLFPTEEAKNLLEKAERDATKTQDTSQSSPRQQSVPDFSELHGSARPEKASYTPTQRDLAQRINSCKDYYAILGVEKDSNESEIKKGYRKMALQLHPDKNLAPGSTEAFKAVGRAFAVLSDAEKRRQYDLYGPEGVEATTRRRRRNSGSEYEEEAFDPQELFNMFFGGGFPSENVRVFRRGNTYYYNRSTRRRPAAEEQNDAATWLRLLPIIVFVLVSFAGNIFNSAPAYSLAKRGEYVRTRETANLKVPFYVRKDFDELYKKGSSARNQLESEVESDYIAYFRNNCYQERANKQNMRTRGLYFGNNDWVKKADQMTTPSCDRLDEMFDRPR